MISKRKKFTKSPQPPPFPREKKTGKRTLINKKPKGGEGGEVSARVFCKKGKGLEKRAKTIVGGRGGGVELGLIEIQK